MRISDWSADVCSSDLQGGPDTFGPDPDHRRGGGQGTEPAAREFPAPDHHLLRRQHALAAAAVSGCDDVVVPAEPDRKSVVYGKRVSVSVDLGGRRFLKNNRR